MSTPPRPPFFSNVKQPNISKTPYQSSNTLFQRSFKSQTNKLPSRSIIDESRYYPLTGQRQTHQPAANNPKNPLAARLRFFARSQQVATNRPAVSASASAYVAPATAANATKNPPSTTATKPSYPTTATKPSLPTTATKPLLPTTATKPALLATATKPPLSVAQYTQPTPVPPNRQNTHQISRAHSEPSIKYQIKVKDKVYKVLRKIGSGGSAKVYEGFEPLTSQTVAIKIINVASVDQKTRDSYFNEEALLAKLRGNQHVVHMYDSEYKADVKELLIVMEKGDTDLSQVIDSYFKTKQSMIDGIFIKFYWRGMVQAVNDIHRHGIVHADLKPVNFILVRNQIKLIDFGIASAVDPGCTSVVKDYQIGTINYMAPESLKNRALEASFQYLRTNDVDENNQQQQHKRTVIKYNAKVDIWSLGCILYNLVYGRPPFDNLKDILSKVQAITNPQHIINFPEISNRKLLNCMKSCLRYNPSDRPSAEDLLNDSYLKEDIIVLQK